MFRLNSLISLVFVMSADLSLTYGNEDILYYKGHRHRDIQDVLHTASMYGDADKVREALKKGAHPSGRLLQTYSDGTEIYDGYPLVAAGIYCHLDTIRLLIGSGADVNVSSYYTGDESPLNVALDCSPASNKALHSVSIEVVRLLIAAGADVNYRAGDGANLPIATYYYLYNNPGHRFENINQLLVAGVDLFGTYQGKTAFELAVRHRGRATIRLLSQYAGKALILASQSGQIDRVRKLITRAGADVNAVNDDKSTSLMLAIQGGHKEVVNVLLNGDDQLPFSAGFFGADIDLQDKNGRNALWHAEQSKNSEIIALLQEASQNSFNPQSESSVGGQSEVATQSVDPSINELNNKGFTKLMLAVRRGQTDRVRELLAAGASTDIQDTRHQNTALIWASWQNRLEIARLLIEAGADVSIKNKRGRNALWHANRRRHTDIVNLLKANGAT